MLKKPGGLAHLSVSYNQAQEVPPKPKRTRHLMKAAFKNSRSPQNRIKYQLQYKQHICIGSLNCHGLIEKTKREHITYVMHKHNVDILCLQETHINTNSQETHKGYHFYFSSAVAEGEREFAGVGIVISDRVRYSLKDFTPVDSRLIHNIS